MTVVYLQEHTQWSQKYADLVCALMLLCCKWLIVAIVVELGGFSEGGSFVLTFHLF